MWGGPVELWLRGADAAGKGKGGPGGEDLQAREFVRVCHVVKGGGQHTASPSLRGITSLTDCYSPPTPGQVSAYALP